MIFLLVGEMRAVMLGNFLMALLVLGQDFLGRFDQRSQLLDFEEEGAAAQIEGGVATGADRDGIIRFIPAFVTHRALQYLKVNFN
jgi:hypothetical protein